MKKALLPLTVIALAICATGCTTYGRLSANLAKDSAIIVADVNSPWGKQTFIRVGVTTNRVVIENGTVSINQ